MKVNLKQPTMNLPSSLRDLQNLCHEKGLKYKGKTKDTLRTLLIELAGEPVDDQINIDDDINDDIEVKKLKDLKLMCQERGLSKVGSKAELIKRIKLFTTNKENDIPVIRWQNRGRKHKEVEEASGKVVDLSLEVTEREDLPNKYQGLKKHELRSICVSRNIPASGNIPVLVKRLLEHDVVNTQIEADQDKLTPAQMCESCQDNPEKLHATPIAKWYCQDCDQKICNLCKDAHLKIKIIRTHVIYPFGTSLDFNIDEDESIIIDVQVEVSNPMTKKRFLDITVDTPKGSPAKKTRLEDVVETDAFEVIYQTPMARMKMNRRTNMIHVDYLNTVPAISCGFESPTSMKQKKHRSDSNCGNKNC